jgi:hypothetical protein
MPVDRIALHDLAREDGERVQVDRWTRVVRALTD